MRATFPVRLPFARAAAHYDLLYRDKDYPAEARFALAALRRLAPGASAVLDLGCGTGRHAVEFARLGCRVTGVDRCGAMLARARRRAALESLPGGGPVFRQADAMTLRLNRRFDAIVALFHVMGYMSGPHALARALARARAHLRPGGALLFDCWHAPAVLKEPLRPRLLRVSDGVSSVERSSCLRHDRAKATVEIRYLFRVSRGTRAPLEFSETHRMRYWRQEEVKALLRAAGFETLDASEWMTGRPLGNSTWSACFTAVRGRQG